MTRYGHEKITLLRELRESQSLARDLAAVAAGTAKPMGAAQPASVAISDADAHGYTREKCQN